ncbi:MAG: alkaline phosphatase [Bacteroidales bacterium]
MKTRIKLLMLIVAGAVMVSCSTTRIGAFKTDKKVRNVILMIGDGMGLPHVYAAMTAAGVPLNIQRTEVTGLQTSYSADNYVTDSAAAGTALSSGTKTNNGMIGVDPQGNKTKSILETAEENGLATGLVASSSVTHATPASFIAHQSSRSSYEDIAKDFLRTDIDVFIGGGYDHFAKRADGLNLIDSLTAKGYEVTTSAETLKNPDSPVKLAALLYPDQPPLRLNGRGDMLYDAARKAIDILNRNRKGFFLMIEGSQIDWAAHASEAEATIDETLDFDRAVGAAIDFAMADGNTLVVITADHETGGVTIPGGDIKSRQAKLHFSTKSHSAVMLPVYAYGPGAGNFTGIYDNTDIPKKILNAYRFNK